MRLFDYTYFRLGALLCAGLLGACGGSDGDGASTTTVTGSIFAAPVSATSVSVLDTNGDIVAGPVTSAADGSYSIDVPDAALSQDLVLVAAGGQFDDEATGAMGVSAGSMSAFLDANSLSAGSRVSVTPGSSIVHQLIAEHGVAHADARTFFNTAFGYTPDTTLIPTDATQPAADAEQDELLAGLRAAVFSQLCADLGMTPADQFALFSALSADLADGTLDGMNTQSVVLVPGTSVELPQDIQNRYERALVNFRGSGRDATGLTSDQIGTFPFAKLALTETYALEYVPGSMAAKEGRTTFDIRVVHRVSEQPQAGLDISLMPVMHMATHHHGTPVDNIVDNGDGSYTCTLYYLMASTMMDGLSMGYWELGVRVDDQTHTEVAYFYPPVMMNMSGDTTRGLLRGQDDVIAGMDAMMDMKRPYFLFNDGLSGNGDDRSLALYIAAREDMMSYPPVFIGTTLNDGDVDYELNIVSMSVEVSTDQSNWIAATHEGDGHWRANGINGVVDGTQATLYVRLMINGEQKTSDGAAPAGDGTNDYAVILATASGGM